MFFFDYYRPQQSYFKVMFLYLSVILVTEEGVSVQRGLYPGGSLSREVSVRGVSLRETPIRLRAGGTHPTGMHSCFRKVWFWPDVLFFNNASFKTKIGIEYF